jgi:hypothetical protein
MSSPKQAVGVFPPVPKGCQIMQKEEKKSKWEAS